MAWSGEELETILVYKKALFLFLPPGANWSLMWYHQA